MSAFRLSRSQGFEEVVPGELILHMVMWGAVSRNGYPGASHPSPLGKVTSWSPTSGSLPLAGFPHGVGGGLLGVHSACRVQPPGRYPPRADAIHGQ